MKRKNLNAKSGEDYSIEEHGEDVKESVEQKVRRAPVLRLLDFCGFDNSEKKEFIRCVNEAAYYHDCGKGSDRWQEAIKNDDKVGHSVKSAFYIWKHFDKNGTYWYIRLAVVIAVLHHHTDLLNNSMDFFSEYTEGDISFDIEVKEVQNMINNLSNNYDYPHYEINEDDIVRFKNFVSMTKRFINEENTENYEKFGIVLTLAFSYLKQSDEEVSARVKDDSDVPDLQELRTQEISEHDDKRPTQKLMKNNVDKDFVTLVENCGGGKTGASVIWAKDKIRKGRADRVIYAMPTQYTAGNMLNELCGKNGGKEHYPEEKSTLYHDNSYSFLEGSDFNERDVMNGEKTRKRFQNGCTVVTVDHLLNSLVNSYYRSNVSKANIMTSCVVIDEIHSYDPVTASNILKCIRILREFDVPVLVMTATLPPQIENHPDLAMSEKITGEGKNPSGTKKRRPCNINLEEKSLSGEEVIKKQEENPQSKRVMVAVNTVYKAKEITNYLMKNDYDVVCYTGRFNKKDRQRKQDFIKEYFNEPFKQPTQLKFLVCTQVCEVSLDISSDLLLTEIAPIDNINQRIGRHHRNGDRPNSQRCSCSQCMSKHNFDYNMFIFSDMKNNDAVYPYASEKDTPEWKLIEQTSEQLKDKDKFSFQTSQEMVSESYKGIELNLWNSKFKEDFKQDLVYGRQRTNDDDDDKPDLNTRDIEDRSMNVLPKYYIRPEKQDIQRVWQLWEEFHGKCKDCKVHKSDENKCKDDFHRFMEQYTVRIPIRKANKINNEKLKLNGHIVMDSDNNPILLQKTTYDYRKGILF